MHKARLAGKFAIIRGTRLVIEDWRNPLKKKKRSPESPINPTNKSEKLNTSSRY